MSLEVIAQWARLCEGVSEDDMLAWEMYRELRKQDGAAVCASGPALPPAMRDDRCERGVRLAPVDIGVYAHPLFLASEYGVGPDGAPGQPPSAVVVEAESKDDTSVVAPVSYRCSAHDGCHAHGLMVYHQGKAHAWCECERGSEDHSCLPGPVRALTVPPDPGVLDRLIQGEAREVSASRAFPFDPGAGAKWVRPVYAGGPVYWDLADGVVKGGGFHNTLSWRVRSVWRDKRGGWGSRAAIGDALGGGARFGRDPWLRTVGGGGPVPPPD